MKAITKILRVFAPALALALAPPSFSAEVPRDASSSAAYLSPMFRPGQRFDNVFSRAVSIRAAGVDEKVGRISGTADYHVSDADPRSPKFLLHSRYDGRPEASQESEFREAGSTTCTEGRCSPYTDASGLLYNARLWGKPPAKLHVGQIWTVNIASPWELGPAGNQTVSVIALNPSNHSVTLKREGHGSGAFLDENLQRTLTQSDKQYAVTVAPGEAHWYGYATFQQGIVISDALMTERSEVLVSDQLGRITAEQRDYILLNALPSV